MNEGEDEGEGEGTGEDMGADGGGEEDEDEDDDEPVQGEPDDDAYRRAFGELEWEPAPRSHTSANVPGEPPSPSIDPDLDSTPRTFNNREAAQEGLKTTPVVERFPTGNPGVPVSEQTSDYQKRDKQFLTVDPNNPYFPFAWRVDWETARWSKIQGPGSNALNDLFKIASVSICAKLHNFECDD